MEKNEKQFGNKTYGYSMPEEEIKKLVSLLKEEGVKKILDLGCGEGRHFRYFTDLDFEVYGIDANEELIDQAKEKSPKSSNRLIIGDMQGLPYSDNFFDTVIANQVIYHTTKKGMIRTICEMYRVLRNDGIFFVTLQPRESQEWRLGEKLEDRTYIASEGPDKGVIHHYVDLEEITELFGKTNLLQVYRDKRNDWCVLGKIVK